MSEQDLINRLADKYRDLGYEVTVEPRGDSVPRFIRPYEPTLVARKGTGGIIVGVKRDRAALAKDPHLSRMAEVANAQPGWRFDLVILEPQTPIEDLASQSSEPSKAEIASLLDHAQNSAESADVPSSFLLAWSGLEAAMRHRTSVEGISHVTPTAPTVLMRMLYAYGFISQEELHQLDIILKTRNSVVHGFADPKPNRNQVDYVVAIGRRLLKEKRTLGATR
jgi:REase_AHJR-like